MPFVAHVPSLDPQSSYGLVRCVKWFSASRQSLFWCGCDRRRTRFGGLPIGNFASIDIRSIKASVGRGSGGGVLESGSNAEAHNPAPDTRDDELQDILKIVALLPAEFRPKLELHEELLNLLEVVMDLGRIPFARFPSGDFALSEDVVTFEDIGYAVSQVGDFGADNRAGIEQTLHRISCLRNRDGKIIGLTCRVGRNIVDSAEMVADLIFSGASVLLLGRPGVGKTTVIRGVSRLLADECKKRVVIVDTSNEIGGDGDVPHPGIGLARRMQVPHPSKQHQVMIEAIENHMPEVIVIDEVGTELECLAAQTISQRGVQLVATAHGNELENILKNPSLANLIGGINVVTLSDEEARRRRGQKSVLERAGPPAFDVAIEMLNRNEWRVHEDLSEAVDTILAGGTAHGEIRRRDHRGKVIAQPGHLYHARQLPPQLPLEPEVTNLASTASVSSSSAESDIPLSGSIYPEAAPSTVPQNQEQIAPGSGILRRHTRRDEHDWLDTGEQAVQKSVVLRLYLWGVDPDELWEVMGVLQLQGRVAITSYLQQANAVLGTKSKLKQGGWIRQAAQDLGIPMYCLKSSAPAQLARALQTFLTFRPAEEMDSVGDTPNIPAQYDCDFDAADYLPDNETCQGDEKEAMEEARLAIEEIVIPRGQPIELLPRVPGIIKMQEKLAEFYNLRSRTIGSGNETRLRVLPSNMTDTGDVEGKQLAGVTAKANRSRDHGTSCQASS